MSVIQILHYYCKPRRADILNNITYRHGISCQVQDSYLDISDIVKELNNKNHIDCIVIDEDLFGSFDAVEDIIAKLEVLKYVCDDTEILLIALDKSREDEIIRAINKSGAADFIITKEMSAGFEEVVVKYFNGECMDEDYQIDSESFQEEDNVVVPPIAAEKEVSSVPIIEEQQTEEASILNVKTFEKSRDETEDKKKRVSGFVLNMFGKTGQDAVFKQEIPAVSSSQIVDAPSQFNTDEKMITIGICGLQPHIGVTHHALAMAQAIAQVYKRVGYKECNTHNIYRVLEQSSLKKNKPGYIQLVDVDVFSSNVDMAVYEEQYNFCIMDFGEIHECRQSEFFNTDIPIIIAGVKDWEIQNFIGAYTSGILDQAAVLINFFPEKEQEDFKQAFSDLKIYFSDYAPEVFEPENNIGMYHQIIKEYLTKAEVE